MPIITDAKVTLEKKVNPNGSTSVRVYAKPEGEVVAGRYTGPNRFEDVRFIYAELKKILDAPLSKIVVVEVEFDVRGVYTGIAIEPEISFRIDDIPLFSTTEDATVGFSLIRGVRLGSPTEITGVRLIGRTSGDVVELAPFTIRDIVPVPMTAALLAAGLLRIGYC